MLLDLDIYPVKCIATKMASATTPEILCFDYSSAEFGSKRSHDAARQAETLVTVRYVGAVINELLCIANEIDQNKHSLPTLSCRWLPEPT